MTHTIVNIVRTIVWIFGISYAIALIFFFADYAFDTDSGSLGGMFLVPIGAPWIFLLDLIPGLPGLLDMILSALTPLINFMILYGIELWLLKRDAKSKA